MNKTEIIAAAAERTRIDKRTTADIANAIFDIIKESLVEGDPVRIAGVGNFGVKHLAARQGKNPKTGEPLDVAARIKVTFSAGKELKKAVNGK